jgi:hypothetical protein
MNKLTDKNDDDIAITKTKIKEMCRKLFNDEELITCRTLIAQYSKIIMDHM